MFCMKCGNALNENEKFCPKCGAKNESPKDSENANLHQCVPDMGGVENNNLSIPTGLSALGNLKMFFYAIIGMLVLSFILSFTSIFKITASSNILNIQKSESLPLLFSSLGVVLVIFILGYIAAVGVLFLPVLTNRVWKKIYLLPTKIILIASTLWFFLMLLMSITSANDVSDYYNVPAHVSVTVTGWFYLIATLGALILSYKMTNDMKKGNVMVSRQRG